jgi:hypothetical protein
VKVSANTFGRISRGVGKAHRGRPKCATVARRVGRRVGRLMECRGQGVEIYGEASSACGELQWPAGELSVSETPKRQCRRTVPDFAALTPGYLLYRAVNMSPGKIKKRKRFRPTQNPNRFLPSAIIALTKAPRSFAEEHVRANKPFIHSCASNEDCAGYKRRINHRELSFAGPGVVWVGLGCLRPVHPHGRTHRRLSRRVVSAARQPHRREPPGNLSARSIRLGTAVAPSLPQPYSACRR